MNEIVRHIHTAWDGTETVTDRVLTDEEQAQSTDRQLLAAYKQIQDPTGADGARAFQVFLRRYA